MIKNPNVQRIISNVESALDSHKLPFWSLWQWAVQFSGGSSTLRWTSETGGRAYGTQSETLDEEAFDPNIKSMLTKAKNYYGGIFFPSNEPWSVNVGGYQDISSRVNARIRNTFNNPKSKWYEAREVFLDNYVRLGTGDLMGIETMDEKCPFVVRSLGIGAMSISPDQTAQHQVFNWTAQQIVDEFGEDAIKTRDDIYSSYKEYNMTSLYKVHHLIIRNPEFVKGATAGKNSRPYVGYWYLDADTILDTVYYQEKPFDINRFSVRPDRVYGFCPLTDLKKTWESLEGLFFLAMSSAGKIADRRMGYFDMGSVGTLELDSDAKYVPFNGGIVGSGSLPIFPIDDSGDITPLFNAIRPQILDGLRQAYNLDAMEGYFAKSGNPRTATEVVALENVQNAMMAPQVRLFAEQLADFRTRITMIVLRSMIRSGEIDDEAIVRRVNAGDTDVFEIEETSVVKRIIYSEKQSQYMSDLNLIGATLQIQPSLVGAVDLYDSLQNVLKFGNINLRNKEDYEAKRDIAEEMALRTSAAQTSAAESQADMLANEAAQ